MGIIIYGLDVESTCIGLEEAANRCCGPSHLLFISYCPSNCLYSMYRYSSFAERRNGAVATHLFFSGLTSSKWSSSTEEQNAAQCCDVGKMVVQTILGGVCVAPFWSPHVEWLQRGGSPCTPQRGSLLLCPSGYITMLELVT